MPMCIDQIDFADRTIRLEVGTTKNGHGRIVKMTQEVYMLIQACALRKQLTITSSLERMIPVLDFRSACREASVQAVSESSTAETAIT